MGRVKWTDDLIDQRMHAIDDKLDGLAGEVRTLRAEMHALRAEMQAGFAVLRSDLSAFQRQVTFIVAAFAVGLLGLLGAGQL